MVKQHYTRQSYTTLHYSTLQYSTAQRYEGETINRSKDAESNVRYGAYHPCEMIFGGPKTNHPEVTPSGRSSSAEGDTWREASDIPSTSG